MDDPRKRYGYPDDERANNEPGNEPNRQEEPASGSSSYYYSYGPFQSLSNERDSEQTEDNPYRRRESQEVEVTAPQPVKPIPSSGYVQSQSAGQQGGSGGPSDAVTRNTQWNYSSKPKTSVKTVLLSFLAGVIVISSLMFAADRTNLFTPDAAFSSEQPSQETAAPVDSSGNGNDSGATTASAMIPTNQGDVSAVVDEAGPAVVLIETLVNSRSGQSSNPSLNDPFWYFFGGGPSSQQEDSGNSGNNGNGGNQQLVPSGLGSGFIFDKSGYILTNEHVIHGADVIQVTVQGTKKPYEAKLLGSSYELDLAVLKIEGDNFPSVKLGDSDSVKVGEWLVAIGNPGGFDHTVTAGVLSSKEREIEIPGTNGEEDRSYKHLLQTDASINPGNSGGPLLNLKGEVIGMNVAVSAEAQGIGFAIPSSTIKEVLDYLKNNQEVPKEPEPFIGAELATVTPQIAQQLGSSVTEGSYVNRVVFRSPAYEADLRQYDIIIGVDGQKYPTHTDLIELIQSKKVGDKITLNVDRNGKKIDLPLTIGDRNEFEASLQQQQRQP